MSDSVLTSQLRRIPTAAGWRQKLGLTGGINVMDPAYGVVGDGVEDDTAGILAAEEDRAAIGGTLIFPPRPYKHSGITIDRSLGGGWIGMPGARFIPTANSVVMMDLTNATVSATAWRDFSIKGFMFDGDGKTGVQAIREDAPYHTTIDN